MPTIADILAAKNGITRDEVAVALKAMCAPTRKRGRGHRGRRGGHKHKRKA